MRVNTRRGNSLKTNSIKKECDASFLNAHVPLVRSKSIPSDNTSNKITLQAQCKDNNKKATFDEKIKNNALEIDKIGLKDYSLVKCIRKTKSRNVRDKNITENLNSNILKPITNNKVCKMNLRSAKTNENKSGTYGTEEPRSRNAKDTVAAKAAKNQIDQLPHSPIKKCVVELQRTPSVTKKANILSSTPYTLRRCANKLQCTQSTAKPEKGSVEPSHTSKTKTCKVRLLKANISEINGGNIETFSMKHFSPIPKIDNAIRNNFRKLSLTRSVKTLEENGETKFKKNFTNSSHKNDYGEETHDIIKNNTNADTPKTISINNEVNPLDSNKKSTKESELKNIKHFAKLTLKSQNAIKNKNTSLEVTHSGQQQNSTIYFEPVRNSTLLESGLIRSENEESKKATTSKKSTSQNLANNSDEIEKLLNSLEDEDENVFNSITNTNENNCSVMDRNKTLETRNNTTTKKFFHREKNVPGNILKERLNQITKSPKITYPKKVRFRAKLSTAGKRDNIYEFLSQSQNSDSSSAKDIDPTADIIKKLIDQGKVRVATNCKGTGRPKFKRKKPLIKQRKKIKQASGKKLEQLKNNTKKVTFREENNKDSEEEDHNYFQDHFDDMEIECPDINSNTINHHKYKDLSNDQQQETISRSDKQTKNTSLAKKNISTPKILKKPFAQYAAPLLELSPIGMLPTRPATKSSPWRVNEDVHLPRTFNFSRSSENLPSYSSDIIPLTQKEEELEVRGLHQTSVMSGKSSTINKQTLASSIASIQTPFNHNTQPQISNLKEPPVLSSFSSNDSNAENMPPPRCAPEKYCENDSIFDLKQLPNPRRGLNKRSPLKTINILEVVHLPPYKFSKKTANPKETNREKSEMFGFEENMGDVSLQENLSVLSVNAVQQKNMLEKTKIRPKENLFGFEDFISETECSSQEYIESNSIDAHRNEQNLSIHEKLQGLQRLKPDKGELEKSLLNKNSTNPIKSIPLFGCDEAREDGMRQRGIKEMLCSTMLHQRPSTSKEALRMLDNRNAKDSKRPNIGDDFDTSELFTDPEPETTFNENNAHRSYIRRNKRKRRLVDKDFVMILESDESEDEDNSHEHQKRQNCRQLNSSSKQSPTKNRNRREQKENKELFKFVQEFNEIVKEVEAYEMAVEKST